MNGSNEINNSISGSFSALPIASQKDILRYLSTNKDVKLARLVSPQWYRMVSQVHPLPSYKLFNNHNILEILKNSFHQKISRLCVQDCTQPLPIYSSTRCNIPTTECLELRDGISAENVIKLIRYYAKSCTTLILDMTSLGYLPSYSLKGYLSYENLRCLDISFHVHASDGNGFEGFEVRERIHLIALTQFLQSVELANLQELHINAAGYSENWLPEDLILYTKFNIAMNVFLEKYGHRLINLGYYNISLEVMESFKYLCNLDKLEAAFSCRKPNGELIRIDDISPALFNDLKKLKTFRFYQEKTYSISYQIISKILQHYRSTIRKFYLFGYNPSIGPLRYFVFLLIASFAKD